MGGNTGLLHFSMSLDSKKEQEHETVIFSHVLTTKNKQEHETVAFFANIDIKKNGRDTRLQHVFTPLDNRNKAKHETVPFVHISKQQKRAGTPDCSTFSHF